MPCLIGDKLRFLRSQHNVTQAELARQLAASRAHINNVEASRKLPSLTLTVQTAVLFGVTTDYLLRDTIPVETTSQYKSPDRPVGKTFFNLLGAKVKYLRTKHNLTQLAVATQLQLAANTHISYLEAGRKDPSLDLVVALADLFSVSTDYLLRDTIPVELTDGGHCE